MNEQSANNILTKDRHLVLGLWPHPKESKNTIKTERIYLSSYRLGGEVVHVCDS